MTKPDPSLLDGLFQLSFVLQGRLARVGAAHELSLIQVRLLGILRDRAPTMNQLARHLELEKSSLSGLIDRAEKRGLVERVPSIDDRRAATVHVTAAGRALSRRITAEVDADMAALTAALSKLERKRLASLVERLVLVADPTVDQD